MPPDEADQEADAESPEPIQTVYAVRLAGSAARLLADEYARREEQNGPEAADRWRAGMLDTIQSLATLPGRCVIAREDRLYPDATVRHIRHRARKHR